VEKVFAMTKYLNQPDLGVQLQEWHWEVTNRCNLNCVHCITDSGKPRKNELSLDGALKALEVIVDLGGKVIKFTGGEPLVHPSMFLLLETCNAMGLQAELLTNGILVDDEIAQRLTSLVSGVGISIDGSRREVHEALRGEGTFERTTNALKALQSRLPVTVFVTISRANIGGIKSMITQLHSWGVKEIRMSDVVLRGRAVANAERLGLSPEIRESLKHTLLETLVPIYGELVNENISCDADATTAYLSAEGRMYLCSEVALASSAYSFGHILDPELPKKLVKAKQHLTEMARQECCYETIVGEHFVISLRRDSPCLFSPRQLGV
jgi:MoaA/NifB/PqqE/SkfB family radical SAM enzyme